MAEFRSYYWAMGTTTFRMKEMNRSIEQQLQLLSDFWGENDEEWDANEELQKRYYNFLKDHYFIVGNAKMPDKDAREKTSGLVELGLIDEHRKLTDAGKRLLEIVHEGDFSSDGNLLDLPRDSFQYFLQLIKASKNVSNSIVRPYVILLYLITQLDADLQNQIYLTQDEFTFLLPLCINIDVFSSVVAAINSARKNNQEVAVNNVILSILMQKENYQQALSEFLTAEVITEGVICSIGLNRKSRKFDKSYYPVYCALHQLACNGINQSAIEAFLNSLENIAIKTNWKAYFFRSTDSNTITTRNAINFIKSELTIFSYKDEKKFRGDFFRILHLLKARATLMDYADLNRRYFKLSDCILFQDDRVRLGILPQALAMHITTWLKNEAFQPCSFSGAALELDDILVGCNLPSKEELVAKATGKSLAELTELGGIDNALKIERYSNFNKLLQNKLTSKKVQHLLRQLENRKNDKDVQNEVSENADIPTIFEYLVGLAWYYVSGCEGDVLEFMNLSLDSELLPKTHASGGQADIVWKYTEKGDSYHSHTLLLEVTLAEKDSQRRLEMEPVSRHLGEYLIANQNSSEGKTAYCTFVTTTLNLNVVADFRGKKTQYYYSKDETQYVNGMKIIPMDTEMLRTILEREIPYERIYSLFEKYYNSSTAPREWEENLRNEINSMKAC